MSSRRPDDVSGPPSRRPEEDKSGPEVLPPEQKQKQQLIAQMEQWSGPLPPPAVLEKFSQIIPNGAERIVAMAEKEQAHRIPYEQNGLAATTGEAKRGQYLGAALSGAAILGAVVVALAGGPQSVAIALLGIPVMGIIRAIIKPRDAPND